MSGTWPIVRPVAGLSTAIVWPLPDPFVLVVVACWSTVAMRPLLVRAALRSPVRASLTSDWLRSQRRPERAHHEVGVRVFAYLHDLAVRQADHPAVGVVVEGAGLRGVRAARLHDYRVAVGDQLLRDNANASGDALAQQAEQVVE